MDLITLTDAPAVASDTRLTQQEAEALAYFQAFCYKHGLKSFYRCATCYTAERPDGCTVGFTTRHVKIKCRCGVREWIGPKGTDITPSLGNTARVLGDTERAAITLSDGTRNSLPALILSDEEAGIVRFFTRVCRELKLQCFTVHPPCWDGSAADTSAMENECDDGQIKLLCKCRLLFYHGATMTN